MMKQYLKCSAPLTTTICLFLLSGSVLSEPPSAVKAAEASATSVTPDVHTLTAQDLAAFTDGIVPQQLKREDIAGAVVLVVKDGTVLFQKGYGYSDVEKKTPVSPDGTLFRPGSISKLFTWTAVMQLVEQGKIDLDRDINDYLDFRIPATFPKPITMRNLMTHTPGFEDSVKDLIVTPGLRPISIGEYLRTHLIQRVYPPGTTPGYSNYGATLAGYIVQRVSGMPFDDYVEKNIFMPLGMTHTSFRQPPSAETLSMMSNGYALASQKPKPYEVICAEPAGSSATSAVDISRFMLAHLQNGEWNGIRILKPETVALMHSDQFSVRPDMPHVALGFWSEMRNGRRLLWHGGDTQYFHSDLVLIPDADVGLFVSYNSAGRGEIQPRFALLDSFLDRYFPYNVPANPKLPGAAADSRLVAGEYITTRRSVTNILSFTALLNNDTVTAAPDGTISVDNFRGENQVPKTWEEIGPLLYREKDGQELLGFTNNSQGRMVMAMGDPFMEWTRVRFTDSKPFNLHLIQFIAIVSLLTLISWPISWCLRRHYRHPLEYNREQWLLRSAVRLIAAIDLFYIWWWAHTLMATGGSTLFDASFDTTLRLVQIMGWLGSLGTIIVLYAVARNWRSPGEWWLSRAGTVFTAISALSFSWFLLHWHLLHFSLLY